MGVMQEQRARTASTEWLPLLLLLGGVVLLVAIGSLVATEMVPGVLVTGRGLLHVAIAVLHHLFH
jgi:hypothetical protein